MHYQQRLTQLSQIGVIMLFQIIQELFLDAELAAAKINPGLAGAGNLLQGCREVVGNMISFVGGTYSYYRSHLGHVRSHCKHRRATQAVTDQQCRCIMVFPQKVRCGQQILQVGRKVGVGKIPITVTQPGKVKAQHGNTFAGEGPGNSRCGGDILAACEAVREQRITTNITFGRFEGAAQQQSVAGKFYLLAHGLSSLFTKT